MRVGVISGSGGSGGSGGCRWPAGGVAAVPEPLEALLGRVARGAKVFADVVQAVLPRLAGAGVLAPAGIVYRFGS